MIINEKKSFIMKNTIIVLLLFASQLSYSQITEYLFDFQYPSQEVGCNPIKEYEHALPNDWKVSHGSPELARIDATTNYNILKLTANQSNSGLTEGVFISHFFSKWHLYNIKIQVATNSELAGFELAAASKLEQTAYLGCNEEVPLLVDSLETIIFKQDVLKTGLLTNKEYEIFNWTPNGNYYQLWLKSLVVGDPSVIYIKSIIIEDLGLIDTKAPSVPQNITIDNYTSTTISLSWDESIDDISGISQYEIEEGPYNYLVSANSEVEFTHLMSCMPYDFRVRAIDRVGNISTWSEYSPVIMTLQEGFDETIENTNLTSKVKYESMSSKSVILEPGFEFTALNQNYVYETLIIDGCGFDLKNDQIITEEDVQMQDLELKTSTSKIVNEKQELVIQPNPATTLVNLSGIEGGKSLKIFNLVGVLEIEIEILNEKTLDVDVSSFSPGIYLVQVDNNETYKLIIK